MKKFLKRLLIGAALVLLIGGGVAWYLHRSLQRGPQFYQQAMQADVKSYSQAGEQLEQQLVNLHNDVLKEDRWSATFTQDQINGWLASEMPKKFAHRLPSSISDPRVSISDEGMRVAFRYQDKRISGVVSLEADAFVSEQENEIGIVVKGLSAGVIPLPVNKWTDRISQAAAKANVPLRWSQQDGNPVALVGVQVHLPDQPDRVLTIETIEFSEGQMHISGTADAPLDTGDSVHGLVLRRSKKSPTDEIETMQR